MVVERIRRSRWEIASVHRSSEQQDLAVRDRNRPRDAVCVSGCYSTRVGIVERGLYRRRVIREAIPDRAKLLRGDVLAEVQIIGVYRTGTELVAGSLPLPSQSHRHHGGSD